jgi:hypothetical protein
MGFIPVKYDNNVKLFGDYGIYLDNSYWVKLNLDSTLENLEMIDSEI